MPNHLNRALDELRGTRTEKELAEELGVSTDTLMRYRSGFIPKSLRALAAYPTLVAAIARDGRTHYVGGERQPRLADP